MSDELATRLLLDGFARVQDGLQRVVLRLTPEQLTWSPTPDANTIAWLAWHLARVQDDHMAGIAGTEQVWLSDGWADRFALPFDPTDIGFGQSADQAHRVAAGSDLLTGYYDAVSAATGRILESMGAADFDRVVDERWDPPVTAAVRVVSVLNDVTQHIGQAAYIRGMLPA